MFTYLTYSVQANLPNLRRLFVDARTVEEESAYSRNAVLLQPSFSAMCTDAKDLIVLQPGPVHVLGGCLQFNSAAHE